MADSEDLVGPVDAHVLTVAQLIVECGPRRAIEVYGMERTLAVLAVLADYVLMMEDNRPLSRLVDRYDVPEG